MRNVAVWQKSSFSSGEGQCVEVRFARDTVFVRDSKYLRDPSNDPAEQPIIILAAADWPRFLDLAAGLTTETVPGIRTVDRHHDGGATITASTGVQLHYTRAEWAAFTAGIRGGEFAAA